MVGLLSWVVLIYLTKLLAAAPVLWNVDTDPMPPLQPKEMGAETLNYQYYYLVSDSSTVVLDINVPGFQFNSLTYQSIMSTTGGEANGVPQIQIAYDNYLNPTSPTASMLVHYDTQTCESGPIEGGSPYTGYDYYTNLLLSLYSEGIPIYFEYVTLPDYGICLQYTATPPWVSNDNNEPRDLTYTLTFQNSTGYLLIYALVGTEYCCLGQNLYCPNSGLCADGTMPLETQANTTQYYSAYQIYENTSWASGFFGAYCPFDTASSDSCNNSGVTVEIALAALFAVLFFFASVIALGLHWKLKESRVALAKSVSTTNNNA